MACSVSLIYNLGLSLINKRFSPTVHKSYIFIFHSQITELLQAHKIEQAKVNFVISRVVKEAG